MLKSPKTNTLADGLIKRTSSMLDETESKTAHKTKKVINRGKRSKPLSEVKPVENISKNLQSFLEISPMQKEVLPSQKLGDLAYEYLNPFRLKEDSLSQRNFQNQLSHPGLSHIEQEFQESLIQGKIHNQQNSNEGLKYSKSYAKTKSLKQLCDSKLSGLHAFDNMTIIH